MLGPTTASDRGRAGVGLDDLVDVVVEVEAGEVMVPSRTCRVPPSTLICRYPLLPSLMSLVSLLSSAMVIPTLSSSSDEEDAPSVSEKPSLLLSSSSEESSSSLNSSTDIMESVPWLITILALSTDRAEGLLFVDTPSFFLVGVDDDEVKSAMAAAAAASGEGPPAAASGEGPPAASAPLFLEPGGVGVMFVDEMRRFSTDFGTLFRIGSVV